MAKMNIAQLYGYVYSEPTIVKNTATGEPMYAHAILVVVRPKREAGDNKPYVKLDNPRIMTRDPKIMAEMAQWHVNDIVLCKGTVSSKPLNKASYCPRDDCGAKNVSQGVLIYVNPIFAKKVMSMGTPDDTPEETQQAQKKALEYITECREVSNQVYIYGTLFREPKKITPREGLTVTQYPIIANRKFRVLSDPVNVKSDYIWIKSYGDNAKNDRERLHRGSEIIVDGCLQARSVMRHAVCEKCGHEYEWKDRAMEIVPFAVEYISNYYTDDEVEQNRKERLKNKIANAKAGLISDAETPLDDENSIES